jgi:hypothetical protein
MTKCPQFVLSDIGPTKVCTKCHEELPADEEFFYRNGGRKKGLKAWCRACVCEANAETYRRAVEKAA